MLVYKGVCYIYYIMLGSLVKIFYIRQNDSEFLENLFVCFSILHVYLSSACSKLQKHNNVSVSMKWGNEYTVLIIG